MYRPRHQAQLGRGVPVPGRTQGSRDCGPRSWQVLIDKQTKGQKRPGVKELRKRGGVEGPQTTNVYDAKRAIESYTNIPGRKPLRYYVQRSEDKIKSAVRNGKGVHLAIDYGTFNDVTYRSGDPYFRGGHSVAVVEQRKTRSGEVEWLLYDSLDDSRRATVPQGPRWVARWKILKAWRALGRWAGVMGGGGKK